MSRPVPIRVRRRTAAPRCAPNPPGRSRRRPRTRPAPRGRRPSPGVSLFASATRFPALSAARVASSPAAPTTALTTMSTSGLVAASTSTSGPQGHVSPPSADRAARRTPGCHSATCRSNSPAIPAAGEGDELGNGLAGGAARRACSDRWIRSSPALPRRAPPFRTRSPRRSWYSAAVDRDDEIKRVEAGRECPRAPGELAGILDSRPPA